MDVSDSVDQKLTGFENEAHALGTDLPDPTRVTAEAGQRRLLDAQLVDRGAGRAHRLVALARHTVVLVGLALWVEVHGRGVLHVPGEYDALTRGDARRVHAEANRGRRRRSPPGTGAPGRHSGQV